MRAIGASVETEPAADFLSHLDFDLPPDRIARFPVPEREKARMFVFNRADEERHHAEVRNITTWLNPGDLLVLNRASVDRVRVLWRDPKGRREEILLLQPLSEEDRSSRWEAIVSGKKLPLGKEYELPGGRTFRLEKRDSESLGIVMLDASVEETRRWLSEFGLPPLPPYIRNERSRHGEAEDVPADRERYQTVFAREGGAVAAPTAGLHFSIPLLEKIRRKGVEVIDIHLAVGWGTFQPVTEEAWERRRLHSEKVSISASAAGAVTRALQERRRVVAVGTTVVRALEGWHQKGRPRTGWTGSCDLFLRAPWSPAVVGALLTNFHLPRSSLLALVAAFLGENGEERILELYREAVARNYRFFSYGACMLIP